MDIARIPQSWLIAAFAVVAFVAIGQAARAAFLRWDRRRKIISRVVRAGEGEKRAAVFLEREGFTVLGTQVASSYALLVDAEPVMVSVRADLLVEKGAARFVVEVKSGRLAPKLETAATRRQLLEYQLAFDVDGVLLYDAEASALRSVVFPARGEATAPAARATWAFAVLLILAALAYVAMRAAG